MSNESRLASLRASASQAIRPDVETEAMLIQRLRNLYKPIFEAVQQIDAEVRSLSKDYETGLYHIRSDLTGKFWAQRLMFRRAPSDIFELVITLYPDHGIINTTTTAGEEIASFGPPASDLAVAVIFKEAEKYFGRV
ncbi:hypothetical protein [Methylobacterium sp. Leaf456]|uniref:hypothetical protein n=1 Tax=Methylobacterium sp. Leaf456 TaxID=1736382 RepID=UPI0012E3E278|nr:hypothetical protein [Methylobacterium sp. Leaf456]